jgi:hypothetical protein
VVLVNPFLHVNQCVRSGDNVISGTNKRPLIEFFGVQSDLLWGVLSAASYRQTTVAGRWYPRAENIDQI